MTLAELTAQIEELKSAGAATEGDLVHIEVGGMFVQVGEVQVRTAPGQPPQIIIKG